MTYLTLIASNGNGDPGANITTESLVLNGIANDGLFGTQAVGGSTGFGLPPVEAQFFEGAGEGSKFRFSRPQARDMDIPVHIETANRTDLKAALAKLARIVAGQFIVRFYNEELTGFDATTDYLWTECVRVGGGTYTYGSGSDTNGQTGWDGIISVRAGSPYWQRSTPVAFSASGAGSKVLTYTNGGGAPAAPVWTLTGPAGGFTVKSDATGAMFSWTGALFSGEVLTVDTRTGAVTSTGGVNRYSGMSYAPKFFPIQPGTGTISTTVVARTTGSRKNYETNPDFNGTTIPWTATNGDPGITTRNGEKKLFIPNGFGATNTATRTYTGLPAGANLIFRASLYAYGGNGRIVVTADQVYTYTLPRSSSTDPVAYSQALTVPANGTVKVAITTGTSSVGSNFLPAEVDKVYLGVPGGYFTGDTPATVGETYAWDGVANNSSSTATEKNIPPVVTLGFTPRDWLVV